MELDFRFGQALLHLNEGIISKLSKLILPLPMGTSTWKQRQGEGEGSLYPCSRDSISTSVITVKHGWQFPFLRPPSMCDMPRGCFITRRKSPHLSSEEEVTASARGSPSTTQQVTMRLGMAKPILLLPTTCENPLLQALLWHREGPCLLSIQMSKLCHCSSPPPSSLEPDSSQMEPGWAGIGRGNSLQVWPRRHGCRRLRASPRLKKIPCHTLPQSALCRVTKSHR